MADVALRAGVSHQTVSRVLNSPHTVKEDTRGRVEQAISELSYRPNVAARTLVTQRSNRIGVIYGGAGFHGPQSALLAIEEAAREQGYFANTAFIDGSDPSGAEQLLGYFLEQSVEGIIIVVPQLAVAAHIAALHTPVPVVFMAAWDADGINDQQVLHVSIDQRLGARLAVNHLLSLGHTTVTHVAGVQEQFDGKERVIGWREALAAQNAPPGQLVEGSWLADDGYLAGLQLAPSIKSGTGPTAIFAANDQLALGLVHAFWEKGISVPDDVSLVGFDDESVARHVTPPLTTLRQPFENLGRTAVGRLLAAIRGERAEQVRIEPTLIRRTSTAPPTR